MIRRRFLTFFLSLSFFVLCNAQEEGVFSDAREEGVLLPVEQASEMKYDILRSISALADFAMEQKKIEDVFRVYLNYQSIFDPSSLSPFNLWLSMKKRGIKFPTPSFLSPPEAYYRSLLQKLEVQLWENAHSDFKASIFHAISKFPLGEKTEFRVERHFATQTFAVAFVFFPEDLLGTLKDRVSNEKDEDIKGFFQFFIKQVNGQEVLDSDYRALSRVFEVSMEYAKELKEFHSRRMEDEE